MSESQIGFWYRVLFSIEPIKPVGLGLIQQMRLMGIPVFKRHLPSKKRQKEKVEMTKKI